MGDMILPCNTGTREFIVRVRRILKTRFKRNIIYPYVLFETENWTEKCVPPTSANFSEIVIGALLNSNDNNAILPCRNMTEKQEISPKTLTPKQTRFDLYGIRKIR